MKLEIALYVAQTLVSFYTHSLGNSAFKKNVFLSLLET